MLFAQRMNWNNMQLNLIRWTTKRWYLIPNKIWIKCREVHINFYCYNTYDVLESRHLHFIPSFCFNLCSTLNRDCMTHYWFRLARNKAKKHKNPTILTLVSSRMTSTTHKSFKFPLNMHQNVDLHWIFTIYDWNVCYST